MNWCAVCWLTGCLPGWSHIQIRTEHTFVRCQNGLIITSWRHWAGSFYRTMPRHSRPAYETIETSNGCVVAAKHKEMFPAVFQFSPETNLILSVGGFRKWLAKSIPCDAVYFQQPKRLTKLQKEIVWCPFHVSLDFCWPVFRSSTTATLGSTIGY